MRKLFLTLFGAVLAFAAPVSAQTAQGATMNKPKILIAYYSYSGNTARRRARFKRKPAAICMKSVRITPIPTRTVR